MDTSTNTSSAPLVRKDSASKSQSPKKPGHIACDSCRRRKTKCDGGKPSCGKCLKDKFTCEYNSERARGRPPASKSKRNVEGEDNSKVLSIGLSDASASLGLEYFKMGNDFTTNGSRFFDSELTPNAAKKQRSLGYRSATYYSHPSVSNFESAHDFSFDPDSRVFFPELSETHSLDNPRNEMGYLHNNFSRATLIPNERDGNYSLLVNNNGLVPDSLGELNPMSFGQPLQRNTGSYPSGSGFRFYNGSANQKTTPRMRKQMQLPNFVESSFDYMPHHRFAAAHSYTLSAPVKFSNSALNNANAGDFVSAYNEFDPPVVGKRASSGLAENYTTRLPFSGSSDSLKFNIFEPGVSNNEPLSGRLEQGGENIESSRVVKRSFDSIQNDLVHSMNLNKNNMRSELESSNNTNGLQLLTSDFSINGNDTKRESDSENSVTNAISGIGSGGIQAQGLPIFEQLNGGDHGAGIGELGHIHSGVNANTEDAPLDRCNLYQKNVSLMPGNALQLHDPYPEHHFSQHPVPMRYEHAPGNGFNNHPMYTDHANYAPVNYFHQIPAYPALKVSDNNKYRKDVELSIIRNRLLANRN
ncbi:Sterol regulatory element-binding protein ECM22 [Zancudomyces culisetae]|uniref:Sterol regulatory element-binding protein ECM22 n=1 Tax=Zancudomyces culisetae TaxID=1213189 RepID=A0A1R1PP75_ZANCU|nr:Sterol regulatory element-binding protein ECM22 [Zancudomyces culisetae]|eukprot:OMH82703.1 Sterol regulatory element-binding protein ECM22 [Zancudomyces culisetae]